MKTYPSNATSCMCDCGCFLIAMEQQCPICGAGNPVYGNRSDIEQEAEGEWEDSEPTPGCCEKCGEKIKGVSVNGLCWSCADDKANKTST